MDPDAGAFFKRSHLSKVALLTLFFTACYFYKERKVPKTQTAAVPVHKKSALRADTLATAKPVIKIKKKKKKIYLTFDDGPNKGTKNVVDIVNAEQVPASFFIIGEHVYGSKLQAKVYDSVLASNYIQIANHSFSHAGNKFYRFYKNTDSVLADFKRCADSLGLGVGIVRTPGRNIWRLQHINKTDIKESTAAADSLQAYGFKVLGWDLEWHFNDKLQAIQTPGELVNQVDSMFKYKLTQSGDHLVLLAHDQVYASAQDSGMLRTFVQTMKKQDEYEFAYIKDYPGIEKFPQVDSLPGKK